MYVAWCNFYRAMLCTARYSYSKLCVCLSVRNVEVLWSHRLGFLPGCSLSTDHNVTDLLQVEHPEILARIGEAGGHQKSGFWCTKALIFLKHGKIGPRLLLLLLRAKIIQYVLSTVPKSTTLDDLFYLRCRHNRIHVYLFIVLCDNVMFVCTSGTQLNKQLIAMTFCRSGLLLT